MGTGHLQHACRPAPDEMVRILSPMSRVWCVTISYKCLNACARLAGVDCNAFFQVSPGLDDIDMIVTIDVTGLQTLNRKQPSSEVSALGALSCICSEDTSLYGCMKRMNYGRHEPRC